MTRLEALRDLLKKQTDHVHQFRSRLRVIEATADPRKVSLDWRRPQVAADRILRRTA